MGARNCTVHRSCACQLSVSLLQWRFAEGRGSGCFTLQPQLLAPHWSSVHASYRLCVSENPLFPQVFLQPTPTLLRIFAPLLCTQQILLFSLTQRGQSPSPRRGTAQLEGSPSPRTPRGLVPLLLLRQTTAQRPVPAKWPPKSSTFYST